jgi:FkbM family methyltransferase
LFAPSAPGELRYSEYVKKIIAVLFLIGAAWTAFATIDKARFAALVLLGRAGDCPMNTALNIRNHFEEQTAIKDKILAASKRLQTDEDYELWQTPGRKYWIPRGSQFVLPFNLAEQAEHIYGTGPQAIHEGDVVLDCGANIGVTVQVALEAKAKTIVAIEPAPENLECLRRNFPDEIAKGQVILYEKGVWDRDDVLTMNIDPHNSAADSVVMKPEGSEGTIKVPLTTVDKIVAELKLDKVDYIKMDIEGAEPNALRGAHDTIAKYKPRLSIASYHVGTHAALIPQIVTQIRPGYLKECGPCNEVRREYRIRPEILYFR